MQRLKLLNNKKGAAIEIAIVFMLIMAIESVMLVSITLSMSSYALKEKNEFLNETLIDNVGEEFYAWAKNPTEENFTYQIEDANYDYKVETNAGNKTLTLKYDGNIVLIVEIDSENKIKKWSSY